MLYSFFFWDKVMSFKVTLNYTFMHLSPWAADSPLLGTSAKITHVPLWWSLHLNYVTLPSRNLFLEPQIVFLNTS